VSDQPKDADVLRDATINSACEQVRALLETNYRKIKAAAVESFEGDENQQEPVAKARISVEFSALSTSPTVAVKCGWSVAYKDESEERIDPLQQKIDL
jgi:hypothetical protein